MRITKIVPALVVFACASPALAQQKVFEWQHGTDESVRLDPANYHGGKAYGSQGGTIHVDVDAQQPVSIFMTGAGEWNGAMQNQDCWARRMVCQREHVIKVTYTCDLPLEPMQLIVRDDRESQSATAFAGLGAVLKSTEALSIVEPELGRAVGVVNAVGSDRRHARPPKQRHAAALCRAKRCKHPILSLDLHQQLLPATVSVDPASEGRIQADNVFEGLRRLRAGPRRRAGQHQDQGAGADARGDGSFIGSESTARQAGYARTGARKNVLQAARAACSRKRSSARSTRRTDRNR